MSSDDLIVAFYPCIYFCEKSQQAFLLSWINYRALNEAQKVEKIMERENKRHEYYLRLERFIYICLVKGLRIIFENPYTQPHYLHNNFLKKPSIIDNNRMLRGDYFRKPTAYWFFNCEPTAGESFQNNKEQRIIERTKRSGKAGLCSEDRSMISSDYARNWICDFVIGKKQNHLLQSELF